MIQGDILKYDWSDGDIVFANDLCFPGEVVDAISEQCKDLKVGARVMTVRGFPE